MIFNAQVSFIDGAKTHKAIMNETKKKVRAYNKVKACAMAVGFAASLPSAGLGSTIEAGVKKVGRRGSDAGWFARAGVKFKMFLASTKQNAKGDRVAPNLPAFHEFGAYGNRERLGDFGRKRVKESTRASHGRRFYVKKGGRPHHTGVIKGRQFLAGWIKRNATMMGIQVAAKYKAAYDVTKIIMKRLK